MITKRRTFRRARANQYRGPKTRSLQPTPSLLASKVNASRKQVVQAGLRVTLRRAAGNQTGAHQGRNRVEKARLIRRQGKLAMMGRKTKIRRIVATNLWTFHRQDKTKSSTWISRSKVNRGLRNKGHLANIGARKGPRLIKAG